MLLGEIIEARFDFPERLRGINGWMEMASQLFTQYPLLAVLLMLIVIDIATGTVAGWIAGNISSVTSYKGILKKGIMVLVVVTARVMELVIPQAPLMALGCLGFIAVELKSIVENCGKAGMPLPPRLKRAFEKFHEDETLKEKPPTVVEVNMEKSNGNKAEPTSKYKRPSDVVLNVKDSGELEICDEKSHSKIVIPSQIKGQQGVRGEQGEQGETGPRGPKGERGDSYPPEGTK